MDFLIFKTTNTNKNVAEMKIDTNTKTYISQYFWNGVGTIGLMKSGMSFGIVKSATTSDPGGSVELASSVNKKLLEAPDLSVP